MQFDTKLTQSLAQPQNNQQRPQDSEMGTTRFPQYQVVLACEQASFWRENVVTVVILFSENVVVTGTGYQMLEVLSFCDWERA